MTNASNQTTTPVDLLLATLLGEIAALQKALQAAGWEIVALRHALGMNPYHIAPRKP